MLAVTLQSPNVHSIAEVPLPAVDSSRVLVRAETLGICGTDLKVVTGAVPSSCPLVLGHELVGRVADSSDPRFPKGRRVLVDPAIRCGNCAQCVQGHFHLCADGGLMGRDGDGVFAEYVVVPPDRLIEVPDGIGRPTAGLLQVLGTCVHALRSVEPVEVAAVIGLGVAGQLIARLLAARGATVIGITRSEHKRQLAARHGAVVAAPEEAARVVDDLGSAPQLVVEAAGTEATLARAIELAAPGATVIGFGTITDGGGGLPYYQLYHKELTLWHPRAAIGEDYADAVALAGSGALDLDDIVTGVFELADFARALDRHSDPATLKVLLTSPGG